MSNYNMAVDMPHEYSCYLKYNASVIICIEVIMKCLQLTSRRIACLFMDSIPTRGMSACPCLRTETI